MAFDKPHRDIEGRPNAVKNNPCKNCLHSLSDDKKITQVSTSFLEIIYKSTWREKLIKKFNRLKKLKYLIKRRKNRQKMIKNRN